MNTIKATEDIIEIAVLSDLGDRIILYNLRYILNNNEE